MTLNFKHSYGLDVKCSQKGSRVQGLVTICGATERSLDHGVSDLVNALIT